MVGAPGFSILARVWWSISVDLSLLKSSSTMMASEIADPTSYKKSEQEKQGSQSGSVSLMSNSVGVR
jgi:hypothetical protein